MKFFLCLFYRGRCLFRIVLIETGTTWLILNISLARIEEKKKSVHQLSLNPICHNEFFLNTSDSKFTTADAAIWKFPSKYFIHGKTQTSERNKTELKNMIELLIEKLRQNLWFSFGSLLPHMHLQCANTSTNNTMTYTICVSLLIFRRRIWIYCAAAKTLDRRKTQFSAY